MGQGNWACPYCWLVTVGWGKLIGLVRNVCWDCSMGQANRACTYCWLELLDGAS